MKDRCFWCARPASPRDSGLIGNHGCGPLCCLPETATSAAQAVCRTCLPERIATRREVARLEARDGRCIACGARTITRRTGRIDCTRPDCDQSIGARWSRVAS